MIRVFSAIQSPRLDYVLNFLSEYFGQPFVRSEAVGADLVYGTEGAGRMRIEPAGLLEERGIYTDEPPAARTADGGYVLFPDDSVFGFDLFSAIFYLLARCEEYATPEKDGYGRFPHTASLAWQGGFLNRPLIHEWLYRFSEQLLGEGYTPPFRFAPTFDIDMAWSYRHKGFARNAGGLLRSLLRRDGTVSDRLDVLLRGHHDPFDCYDFLDKLHGHFALRPHYFIHAGTGRNAYDKNIPLKKSAMQQLLRRIARSSTVGLHPSWASGDEPAFVAEEKKALESAVGAPVTSSRQHFIRFTLPHSFRQLIAAGITDDYSMGYGSINGFRASVAVPFYWYDLERDEQTQLRLHPFCFMDANALFEQKQSITQTEAELNTCLETFRQWGGTFISIWHNSYLGSAPEYAGWPELYARFVAKGSERKNADLL
ncbi:MAG: hypothetical protein EOO16_24835 [Chitinophagaceae bacterium]|nr:MAG: hypothetical protein EOO16_24835 [Chitinophagaceae bacterium]